MIWVGALVSSAYRTLAQTFALIASLAAVFGTYGSLGRSKFGRNPNLSASIMAGRSASSGGDGILRGLGAASRGVILQTSLLLVARAIVPLLLPSGYRDHQPGAFYSLQTTILSCFQLIFTLAALASAAFDSLPPALANLAVGWFGPRGPTSGILLAYESLVLVIGPLIACVEAATITVDAVAMGKKMMHKMRYHPVSHALLPEEKIVWKIAILVFSALCMALMVVISLLLHDASPTGYKNAWVLLPGAAFLALLIILLAVEDSNMFEISFLAAYCSVLALFARIEAASLQVPLGEHTILGVHLLRSQGLILFLSVPLAVYSIRRAPAILSAAVDEPIDFAGLSVVQSVCSTVTLTSRLLVYHGMEPAQYWPASLRVAQAITAFVAYTLCLLEDSENEPVNADAKND